MSVPKVIRCKPLEITVIKLRLRDTHRSELNRQARAVNFVWNYCNETQRKAAVAHRRWLTAYDLQKLTSGTSKELGLNSATITAICEQYVQSRGRHKKPWLRFRGRKSLGWVPYKAAYLKFDGQTFKFRGAKYQPMHFGQMVPDADIRAGSFNSDSKGNWYINVTVRRPIGAASGETAVGIDLGLKELARLSSGETISAPQYYRKAQERLGKAQRAGKKRLTRNIAIKVANARKDFLHKASARIASTYGVIFVGDVSSKQLAQTKMAKSVLDAGWSKLRTQLSYKAIRHGGRMFDVDESYTSQTCSACGALPEGRPRGIAGLGIREWTCGECKSVHDRDVNAARNILARGMASLVEGAASIKRSIQLTTEQV